MAEHAIGAATHNPLPRLDRHLAVEVPAQAHDRPVTKHGSCEDDGEPQTERPPVVGVDAEPRDPRDREGGGDAEIYGEGDDQSCPPILPHRGAAATTSQCATGSCKSDAIALSSVRAHICALSSLRSCLRTRFKTKPCAAGPRWTHPGDEASF